MSPFAPTGGYGLALAYGLSVGEIAGLLSISRMLHCSWSRIQLPRILTDLIVSTNLIAWTKILAMRPRH